MDVVALVSGGKDSCYAMMECVKHGHKIVALANLYPATAVGDVRDEIDSYMFQSVGHQAVGLFGELMQIPLFRKAIRGKALQQTLTYDANRIPSGDTDEVEDLYELLKEVKEKCPTVQAVSSGAILSDYQRNRVENVCSRLGLISLAYLWRRSQRELLAEMISSGVEAIIIKVAALGLLPRHLGKPLSEMYPLLCQLHDRYGLNECGEGGEYESLTLWCPLFGRRCLSVGTAIPVVHTADPYCPVAYLHCAAVAVADHAPPPPHALARFPPSPWDRSAAGLPQMSSPPPLLLAAPLPARCRQSRKSSLAYISAVVPAAAVSSDSIEAHVESALSTLRGQLPGGADPALVTVYLRDMSDFDGLNRVYRRFIGGSQPPARVTVGVGLQERAMLDAVVGLGDARHLQVQSISRWAPACIGPYSQWKAVRVAAATWLGFFAGSIALRPATMALRWAAPPPSDAGLRQARAQTRQSLWNVGRVMAAVGCRSPRNVLMATAFVDRCLPWDDACPVVRRAWAEWVGQLALDPHPAEIADEEGLDAADNDAVDETPAVLLQLVPVCSLPRGALVEMHLLGLQHESDSPVAIAYSSSAAEWQSPIGSLRMERQHARCEGAVQAISVSLAAPSEAPLTALSPSQALSLLCDMTRAALGPLDAQDVIWIKIYHYASVSTVEIAKAMEQVFPGATDLPLTCVPIYPCGSWTVEVVCNTP